jgi:CSLREA domain-containing protein
MKKYQSAVNALRRGALAQGLSLALISLLASLPASGLVKPSGPSSQQEFGAGAPTAPTVIGTIFTVNSTDDTTGVCPSAHCTLRGAILAANQSAGDDGISFAIPATDPGCASGACTINLNSALPDLSTNIAINGPGPGNLTVRRNAAANFRIFNVTTTGSASISGLTLRDGNISFEQGGGIRNVTGTLNVMNCTLSNNTAPNGGAIFSSGPLNITNSTITGNIAPVGPGGILFNSSASANITNTTISGNIAEIGGGLQVANGTMTISNSTISDNTATGGGDAAGDAGGILVASATVNILNSTISGNTGNGGKGGGMLLDFQSVVNLTGTTISNNKAGFGGGIYSQHAVNILDSTINNNSANPPNSNSIGGAGVLLSAGTGSITNSTISNNSANADAGGIFVDSTGSLTLTNSTIVSNNAVGCGGLCLNGPTQAKSNIVALNNGGQFPDATGQFISQGYNLVGKPAGVNASLFQPTDQVGTTSSPLNPRIDPAGLQDNGGPTRTIALLPGSPGIDKGSSHGLTGDLTTDQRGLGFPRTSNDPNVPDASGGDGTDIGAFEVKTAAPTPTPTPTPTPKTIQFSAPSYQVGEGDQQVTLTVTRSGDASGAASVSFATSDAAGAQNCNVVTGVASSRCDYETRLATIQFAAGETSKAISVFIIDDSYLEGPETFNATLSNPSGASLGSPATATVTINDNDNFNGPNPIDTAAFFVRVHYLDFLNRLPDASGLDFWTHNISDCGTDQPCVDSKRINTSAAFYLSIEFQQTGYLVERIYKTSYGDAHGSSTLGGTHQLAVPVVRLNEFLFDTQEIGQGVVVGQTGWEQQLESNKQAFVTEFVQRSRFTTTFPSTMTAGQFVDALNANAGSPLSQSERDQLVSDLSSNAKTRGQVLRAVAEHPNLAAAESNRAFVLMQFFGYLRRNPNDPQDTDYTGYDFWLTKLNQFNGNFINAEMVKAFITSSEYRQRFGP